MACLADQAQRTKCQTPCHGRFLLRNQRKGTPIVPSERCWWPSPGALNPSWLKSTRQLPDLQLCLPIGCPFWTTKMRKDVTEFISACTVCAQQKSSTNPLAGLLQPLPVPRPPWWVRVSMWQVAVPSGSRSACCVCPFCYCLIYFVVRVCWSLSSCLVLSVTAFPAIMCFTCFIISLSLPHVFKLCSPFLLR